MRHTVAAKAIDFRGLYRNRANSLVAGTLNTMRAAMRMQKGPNSAATLNLAPRHLIVPATMEGIARALLTSQGDPAGTHAGVNNIWRNSLDLVVEARLDASTVS